MIDWLETSDETGLFLSVLTLGEIKKGIDRLPEGKRRATLSRDYVSIRARFAGRLLSVNDAIAEKWGEISAQASRLGRAVHVVDAAPCGNIHRAWAHAGHAQRI